ncbi:hypothetical protein ACQBAT_07055 [Ornithinimicrobium sp. Y1847]|uniref:hypothetical protein n=1 Tax=Ornithinimicrobium sp. Y1847 TaxID=3405419 RepID=UPI003B678848
MRARTRSVGALLLVLGLGSVGGCTWLGGGGSGTSEPADNPKVRTLAKVQGWDEGLGEPSDEFGVLEIAWDEVQAEELWSEAVPSSLASGARLPDKPGLYGELRSVDLSTHVVALWSGGESGTCPEYVDRIALDRGSVVVTTARSSRFEQCTADYNGYRAVVSVPRKDLPDQDDVDSTPGLWREKGMSSGGQEIRLADFADRD